MEFQYPSTSLFTPEGREVVAWSVEEFGSLKMQGYTETRPVVVVPEVKPKTEVKPKAVKVASIAAAEPKSA